MRPSRPDCNDNFAMKHRLIWEMNKGPIPENMVVIFKDGNKRNFDIANLALITRQDAVEMSRRNLYSENADITEVGITVAKVYREIHKQQKRLKG